jgi:hypothetical protein
MALTSMLAVAAAASSPVGLTYLREPEVRDVVHGYAEAPLAGPAKAAHAVLRALGAQRLAARVRLASATADAARDGDDRARRVQLELRDPRLLDAAQSEIILLDRLGASAIARAEPALHISSGRDAKRSRASARGYGQVLGAGHAPARGAADDDSPRAGAAPTATPLGSLKTGAASILVAARADAKSERRPRRGSTPSLLAASPPSSPRREAAPLPPRWYAAHDQMSGRTYYWHEDGRTTWTRPSVPSTAGSAGSKPAREQPANSAAEARYGAVDSAAAARAGKVGAKPRASAASSAASPAGQAAAGVTGEGLEDEMDKMRPNLLSQLRSNLSGLRTIDDSTSKNGSLKKTAAMFALLLVAAAGVL